MGVLAVLAALSVETQGPISIIAEVPSPPTPVLAEGRARLVYEIHLTNFGRADLALTGIDVLTEGAEPLSSLRDAALAKALVPIGPPGAAPLAGGRRAVAFLFVDVDPKAVPRTLRHRLAFGAETVETAPVPVRREAPSTIHPPLRGTWLATNGLANDTGHRRSIYPLGGRAVIAQRFATDWIMLNEDGRVGRGDLSKVESWSGYDAEVLAVADGTVVSIKDGIPDNVPLTKVRAVPITLETVAGNSVVLDLGRGRFASYGHLRAGSLRVKPGSRVRRGETIGRLGNSGNSDVPHLHFHVADGPSVLAAEGIPYVLDSFVRLGRAKDQAMVVLGPGWRPEAAPTTVRRELPTKDAVVRFPQLPT